MRKMEGETVGMVRRGLVTVCDRPRNYVFRIIWTNCFTKWFTV